MMAKAAAVAVVVADQAVADQAVVGFKAEAEVAEAEEDAFDYF